MALHRTADRLAGSEACPRPDSTGFGGADRYHPVRGRRHLCLAISHTDRGTIVTAELATETQTGRPDADWPRAARRSALRAAPPVPHRASLSELESWTFTLAQALAEMLAGARSPGQLHGVATLDVIRQVERCYGTFGARLGELPVRPVVRSVHVREIEPHSTEASAVVAIGGRVRAVALRLDLTDRGWCCTAVESG